MHGLIPVEPVPLIDILLLGTFDAVDQAFFMGLFFLLSAYFIAASYERKGVKGYLKDRLIRLGIPILAFAFLVFPILEYVLFFRDTTSYFAFFFNTYLNFGEPFLSEPGAMGISLWHVWFLELLLALDIFYVAWRMISGKTRGDGSKLKFPDTPAILLFTGTLALVLFIVRIWWPLPSWIRVPFLEPGYMPIYLAFFGIGILAYRNGWFDRIPAAAIRLWPKATLLMIPALLALYFIFGQSVIEGGFTLASFAYTSCETVICVGMCITLVWLFRERFNREGKLSKAMAENAFAVYLIHYPIIVLLQYSLMGIPIHPLAKFAIVSAIGVPASFLMSHYAVRKLPYAKYVLG